MKARNKVTGEVVSNFGWSKDYGTISYIGADGFLHNYSGRAEDWEIFDESETDWDAYRREAAKDIVCAILATGLEQTDDKDKHFYSFEELATASVAWADTLIKKLQEK